ncbi:Fork head transcription factor 1 [Gracilariopsis chorda]|uniref:Fork head transcription factor 1 n=1 Tax=Gracilariopsis chorda TaxID=448386 RepID=A0A2V3IR96_9FLOR|nr:Fork head transcription factor 1 [Gracilariopsis chorda]|eukprot:PXF44619.1 Fork head transcription factor 1 [Gracilariopsis chorda]
MSEIRAYAKLVGRDWQYYMTKPMIVLGRGGKDIECDVTLSNNTVVSRQHFTIRFVPELQAFEVKTLSKNGIIVNGEFLHKLSPPVILRSQADILYGKNDDMCFSFLIPSGGRPTLKKKSSQHNSQVPLLQWIGEALLGGTPLNGKQIRDRIESIHPNQLRKLGTEHIISSSIRHVLTQNNHIFFVYDWNAVGTKTSHRGDASAYTNGNNDACFSIYERQKSRFFQRSTTQADKEQRKSTNQSTQPP